MKIFHGKQERIISEHRMIFLCHEDVHLAVCWPQASFFHLHQWCDKEMNRCLPSQHDSVWKNWVYEQQQFTVHSIYPQHSLNPSSWYRVGLWLLSSTQSSFKFLVPVNVTSFGNCSFKLRILRQDHNMWPKTTLCQIWPRKAKGWPSCQIMYMCLLTITKAPVAHTGKHIQEALPRQIQRQVFMMLPQAQGCWKLLDNGRCKGLNHPATLRGKVTLPHQKLVASRTLEEYILL